MLLWRGEEVDDAVDGSGVEGVMGVETVVVAMGGEEEEGGEGIGLALLERQVEETKVVDARGVRGEIWRCG